MRAKWYLGTLILILAYFGVSQNKVALPNQEIVVQFANGKVSNTISQSTINTIKQQLVAIGVSNVEVKKLKNGQLKIRYYSDTDVISVRQTLLSQKSLSFNSNPKKNNHLPSKLPVENPLDNYNLDVFEIQKGDSDSGLNGKYVLELKQEYIRFSNPNLQAFAATLVFNENYSEFKLSHTTSKTIEPSIENRSYNIPEVRAGPNC